MINQSNSAELTVNESLARRLYTNRMTVTRIQRERLTCLLLISAGGLILVASLMAQSPASVKDESAIRGLVQRYVDAREQKNPQAVEALFTGDADQLVSTGEWRRGRDAVVKGVITSSQSMAGKRTIQVETIRIVAPDIALADGRYEVAGAPGGDRKMWSTFVMARGPDGWRIAAIRNMLPAPATPR